MQTSTRDVSLSNDENIEHKPLEPFMIPRPGFAYEYGHSGPIKLYLPTFYQTANHARKEFSAERTRHFVSSILNSLGQTDANNALFNLSTASDNGGYSYHGPFGREADQHIVDAVKTYFEGFTEDTIEEPVGDYQKSDFALAGDLSNKIIKLQTGIHKFDPIVASNHSIPKSKLEEYADLDGTIGTALNTDHSACRFKLPYNVFSIASDKEGVQSIIWHADVKTCSGSRQALTGPHLEQALGRLQAAIDSDASKHQDLIKALQRAKAYAMDPDPIDLDPLLCKITEDYLNGPDSTLRCHELLNGSRSTRQQLTSKHLRNKPMTQKDILEGLGTLLEDQVSGVRVTQYDSGRTNELPQRTQDLIKEVIPKTWDILGTRPPNGSSNLQWSKALSKLTKNIHSGFLFWHGPPGSDDTVNGADDDADRQCIVRLDFVPSSVVPEEDRYFSGTNREPMPEWYIQYNAIIKPSGEPTNEKWTRRLDNTHYIPVHRSNPNTSDPGTWRTGSVVIRTHNGDQPASETSESGNRIETTGELVRWT